MNQYKVTHLNHPLFESKIDLIQNQLYKFFFFFLVRGWTPAAMKSGCTGIQSSVPQNNIVRPIRPLYLRDFPQDVCKGLLVLHNIYIYIFYKWINVQEKHIFVLHIMPKQEIGIHLIQLSSRHLIKHVVRCFFFFSFLFFVFLIQVTLVANANKKWPYFP